MADRLAGWREELKTGKQAEPTFVDPLLICIVIAVWIVKSISLYSKNTSYNV